MKRYLGHLAVALIVLAATLVGAATSPTHAGASVAGPYPGAVAFRPDGVLRSAPAAVTLGSSASSVSAAFVVGTDGGVWWATSSAPWQPLGSPPGGLRGDPAAVSWSPGRIDVFARGADDHLWQTWTACGGCQWSGWAKPLGDDGVLASSPSATSWGPGRIDIFVLGTDGNIFQRYWDTSSWNPAWQWLSRPSGAGVTDHPAAASWARGRLDVFVRGGDGHLWQSFLANGAWSGWFHPGGTEGGTLASAPAAGPWTAGSSDPPKMTVATRGTDGHPYQTTWDGGWSGWQAVGSPQNLLVGAPALSTTLGRNPVLLTRGTDDRAYAYFPPAPPLAAITYTYSIASTGAIRSDMNAFAAHVAAVYSDTRGWSLGGRIAFVRVGSGGDFTVWLANPNAVPTFSSGCSANLSCRAGRNVIINDDRWSFGALAPWPAPLDDFRTFEINHETGHWLGLHHPCMDGPCSPPGQLAPVMMQQPKGLFGDLPNWWPLPSERQLVSSARFGSGVAPLSRQLPPVFVEP